MAEHLWKDCVSWLVRCQVLPMDHRVTWPQAQVLDLARTLQDGSILCQLLHILKPKCLDLSAINLRPQMSEFLCMKNISLFLETCQTHFGMKSSQLFEPQMLLELGPDFVKVIECLSDLSKTQAVEGRGFPHFPTRTPSNQVEYYNMEPFQKLDEEWAENDATNDLDGPLEPAHVLRTSKEEEHLYEDLLYIKLPARKVDQAPEAKDKREYCIEELLDTERNYLEALEMIVNKFLKPVKNVMTADDVLTVFINIEELAQCHASFYADLKKACHHTSMNTEKKIKECFLKWRADFTKYGRYCAELPKAQQRLDELCKADITVGDVIKRSQNETNDGKFRLRDLLSLPMQRILKYHLLLSTLKKFSSSSSREDLAELDAAFSVMIDLANYVNEVKRDSEMIDIIKTVEASIVDLTMPDGTHLTEYGRLLIDGQVRFRPHEATSPKTRHIFVFNRVLIIVKPFKANQYTYKDALIINDFRVDETLPSKPLKDKWSHQWHIFNSKDHRVAYTMAVKTESLREKWITAIKSALESLEPSTLLLSTPHHLAFTSFSQPTLCAVCDKFLLGSFFQGYECSVCKGAVHKQCIPFFKDCSTKPSVPSRSQSSLSSSSLNKNHRHSSGGTTATNRMRNPRTMSMGAFTGIPSSGGNLPSLGSSGSLREESASPASSNSRNSLDQERENTVQLPYASRSSTMSPSTPHPISPFNPFSPSSNGSFSYQTEDEQQLSPFPWFAGRMDRDKAGNILQKFPNETFLLRISNKGEPYKAISVKYEDKVRHIKVLQSADNHFYLAPVKYFRSVPELVQWYENNSLAKSFQGMNCTLKIPYKKALLPQTSEGEELVYPRAVVRYNFAGTAANMLTINVGDEVEILARSGEQRGWWKGRCNGKIGYFPLTYVEEITD